MRIVSFDVPGAPQGKGRHRNAIRQSRLRGQYVAQITPPKTRAYEAEIKNAAWRAMRGQPIMAGAVLVDLTVRMPIPDSYSKTRRALCLDGKEKPTKKPDLDNVIKSFLDGMNKTVFDDDSQIVGFTVRKLYSEQAGVAVQVTEVLY